MVERLLYTQGEAAEMLGVSVRMLLGEVHAGNLRYILIGKRRKFAREDIEDFIRRGRREWSTVARKRRTGRLTSQSTVIGFEEALARHKNRRKK